MVRCIVSSMLTVVEGQFHSAANRAVLRVNGRIDGRSRRRRIPLSVRDWLKAIAKVTPRRSGDDPLLVGPEVSDAMVQSPKPTRFDVGVESDRLERRSDFRFLEPSIHCPFRRGSGWKSVRRTSVSMARAGARVALVLGSCPLRGRILTRVGA